MPYAALNDRLAEVRSRIEDHRRFGGWDQQVRIVAVTKTLGEAAVLAAATAGLADVGENRVDEAIAKQAAASAAPVVWHLIGALQRRKVPRAVGHFGLIHSIDRLELAAAISGQVEALLPQSVLVQVNCSGEPQKSGVRPDDLLTLLDGMRELTGVKVKGLMTMAAFEASEVELHRTFGHLRTLLGLANQAGHSMHELSMGMSDDFHVAVEEGATVVRLGTVLFGPRPGHN